MGLKLVTPPAEEPFTLADAKAQVRADSDDEDALLSAQIVAARQWCEAFTKRSFVTTTWDYTLDCFPCVIRPPRSPLVAVGQITYLDDGGNSQTLDPAVYRVDAVTEPGRIAPDYNQVWPTTYPVINAVTVQFTAGYGAAADVPEEIKAAIKLLMTELFDFRSQIVTATVVAKIKSSVDVLLLPHAVDWF